MSGFYYRYSKDLQIASPSKEDIVVGKPLSWSQLDGNLLYIKETFNDLYDKLGITQDTNTSDYNYKGSILLRLNQKANISNPSFVGSINLPRKTNKTTETEGNLVYNSDKQTLSLYSKNATGVGSWVDLATTSSNSGYLSLLGGTVVGSVNFVFNQDNKTAGIFVSKVYDQPVNLPGLKDGISQKYGVPNISWVENYTANLIKTQIDNKVNNKESEVVVKSVQTDSVQATTITATTLQGNLDCGVLS